jgi:hypothetical protein
MKYIDAALERLKTKHSVDESDLSLVERILAGEPDPKTAYIFALDLILVGIDTVSAPAGAQGQVTDSQHPLFLNSRFSRR